MLTTSTISEAPSVGPQGAPVAPHLYLALDCAAPLTAPERHSLAELDVVQLGRGNSRSVAHTTHEGQRVLVVQLADRWMSRRHARLHRVEGRWLLEDQASRNGVRVNGARVTRLELGDGDVLEVGRSFLVFRAAQRMVTAHRVAGHDTQTLVPEAEAQYAQLATVARAGVPVMIRGESGVGKELAARLVHQLSGRRGPFIPVNCGAMPLELLPSQLFGHQKGAFTGASESREGYFRAAHGGTLFLDEVGELPLPAQPTLLRVLQEREVTPVGGTKALPVDLQLVTATHRDLDASVQRGEFRADLLARLSGFTLQLPPLRARREDLGLIVGRLLARMGAKTASFSPEAARSLFSRSWPMNVRELEKALLVGVALSGEAKVLALEHLPPAQPSPASSEVGHRQSAEDQALKETLTRLLSASRGNVSAVARTMGKARMQVQRWLRRFGLDAQQFR